MLVRQEHIVDVQAAELVTIVERSNLRKKPRCKGVCESDRSGLGGDSGYLVSHHINEIEWEVLILFPAVGIRKELQEVLKMRCLLYTL